MENRLIQRIDWYEDLPLPSREPYYTGVFSQHDNRRLTKAD
jgi:hypothetical protein